MTARAAWLASLVDVARAHGRLAALSGAAAAIGTLLGDSTITVGDTPPTPAPPPPTADPLLLDELHHVLLPSAERRAGGVVRSPPLLAAALVERALVHQRHPERVLDPSCGGGVFLLALADALVARGADADELLDGALRGIDIDPTAASVARASLTLWARSRGSGAGPAGVQVADALVALGSQGPLDLVVGNPPFRSPVGSGGATVAGGGGARYADDATRFAAAAFEALAPGGIVALLAPRSLLGASDAALLRRAVDVGGTLREVWLDDGPCFEGTEVRVVAPIIERAGGRAPATSSQVAVTVGLPPREVATVDRDRLRAAWSPIIAAAQGIPTVWLQSRELLGDRWRCTAGFRDEFYAVAAVVREHAAQHVGCRRVLTSGLIDPLWDRWGTTSARLGGVRYSAPCLDAGALAAHDASVGRWLDARSVPKVLVATQTAAIEGVLDRSGGCVPCTPVVSVEGEELDLLAALLCSPAASAWLVAQRAGTGRSAGSVRVSAQALRALPLPEDGVAWREAAAMVGSLVSPPDAAWLELLGRAMVAAHRCDVDVLAWWLPRVTRRTVGHR